ncbi:MAG: hypothetical protein IKV80_10055 [Bacteroidales bacterium]|nr:hypothetical protein [Bacteroidales bacterium]
MDINKEYKYYIDNQKELVKKYNNRVLVIVNQNVVGDYDNEEQAYFASKDKYGLGNFLIQKCTENEKGYEATYTSRVRMVYE